MLIGLGEGEKIGHDGQGFCQLRGWFLVTLKRDDRSFGDYSLQDMFGLLWSCRSRSPSTMVVALALADLEHAVASAVVAEPVFWKLCWC